MSKIENLTILTRIRNVQNQESKYSNYMIDMMLARLDKYSFSLCSADRTSSIIVELLTYLIGFNSCLNPWIYFCFNCRNFVHKPGRRSARSATATTNTNLNTERGSVQLSQSISHKELQEVITTAMNSQPTESDSLIGGVQTETHIE